MYVPAHFKPDDEAVRDLLRHPGAANLITATTDGLMATMLPLVYDEGVEGKSKLSQNRSDADIAGAIEGLEARGERAVSGAMRALGRGTDDVARSQH